MCLFILFCFICQLEIHILRVSFKELFIKFSYVMWLHTILKSCIKLNDIVMNKPLFFMLLFCEIYILKLLTCMNAYNA